MKTMVQMKYECRVPGCTSMYVDSNAMVRHEKWRHEGCECGWVGTQHSSHRAMMMRFGHSNAHVKSYSFIPAEFDGQPQLPEDKRTVGW